MNIEGVTMTSSSIRIIVPPARVRDVQRLLSLEGAGFIQTSTVHFDSNEGGFVAELDGEQASHLLELLEIAMDSRSAETWYERQARERQQIPLFFGGAGAAP